MKQAKQIVPSGPLSTRNHVTLRTYITESLKQLIDCHSGAVVFRGLCLQNWKLCPQQENLTKLAAETVFSVSEIEALHEVFKRLSNALIEDGLIHKEEFQFALFRNSNKENVFANRVFELFDVKKNGVIEFEEFVYSLNIFHPDFSAEGKIDFLFRLYDIKQSGFIERNEVKEMLLALLSESEVELSEEAVSAILDKTFTEADLNMDGKIDKEEWRVFVHKYPSLMKMMTLPHLKNVTTAFPSFIFNSVMEDVSL